MTCNYTSTNVTVPEINATNKNHFIFSPLAYNRDYSSRNVTLRVFLVDYYPNVNASQYFIATTLGYLSPELPNLIYYVNSSAIIYNSS